jgi:hypothetical protein
MGSLTADCPVFCLPGRRESALEHADITGTRLYIEVPTEGSLCVVALLGVTADPTPISGVEDFLNSQLSLT